MRLSRGSIKSVERLRQLHPDVGFCWDFASEDEHVDEKVTPLERIYDAAEARGDLGLDPRTGLKRA